MKHLFIISIFVLPTLLLGQAPAPSGGRGNPQADAPAPFRLGGLTPLASDATQPVPRMPDGTVDLWGTWVGGGEIEDMEKDGGLKAGELDSLMLPSAKALMASRARTPEKDPHNFCLPMGVPRQAGAFPWRFVRYPTHGPATHMFVLFEGNAHMYRQIFMDGRKHPPDPTPTWFGHSIGWWEGDTLVIDTVGYNDKFWFDRRGRPHTEQLHTIERWTRVDYSTLTNQVTIDDPGAYSKPFTLKFTARLSKPGDELMEYVCLENDQFGLAGGYANPYVEK
jgi:hypothetical protein